MTEFTNVVTPSGRKAYYADEVDDEVARLEAELKSWERSANKAQDRCDKAIIERDALARKVAYLERVIQAKIISAKHTAKQIEGDA